MQGIHYGVPGLLVDGTDVEATLKGGRAVVDFVRKQGPAILQVTPHCGLFAQSASKLHSHSSVGVALRRLASLGVGRIAWRRSESLGASGALGVFKHNLPPPR